jgi:hypothetical protein
MAEYTIYLESNALSGEKRASWEAVATVEADTQRDAIEKYLRRTVHRAPWCGSLVADFSDRIGEELPRCLIPCWVYTNERRITAIFSKKELEAQNINAKGENDVPC